MTTREAIHKAIEIAGGATEFARKVGVAYKTVMDWKSGRSGVSQLNCLKIEKAVEGKVTRQEILPSYNWNETKTAEKNDKLEIAKKMIKEGMNKNTVFRITGIAIEELEKIEN